MKCPFCDVEMLRGYLYCDVAIWSTQLEKIAQDIAQGQAHFDEHELLEDS